MNRADSKVVLRNIENQIKVGGQNDGLDLPKKRRATFIDVTNNENADVGLKKTKCAKKQTTHQPLAQNLQPSVRQPLQVRQPKAAAVKQQTSAVAKGSVRTAVVKSQTVKQAQYSGQQQQPDEQCSTKLAVVVGQLSQACQRLENETESDTMMTSYDGDGSAIDSRPASQSEPSVAEFDSKPSSQSEPSVAETTNASSPVVDIEMEDLCSRFEWIDVDKEHRDSPYYVTEYINDIFEYYKLREVQFSVKDYMNTIQNSAYPGELSTQMRAILVDWLVEVQQNFELTHETLYLAVKMVDRYLSIEPVRKDKLQLVGACALCIACKYEERCPPILDDYLYVCDDAYNSTEFLEMETLLLKALDFEIGCPISYTFLRRYAQCARVSIPTLTLARYMTESALIDYQYIQESESRLAAAALLLAMAIRGEGSWDATMVHYTGFIKSDLIDLVSRLNLMIGTPPARSLITVHTKYSHEVFHKVATLSALSEVQLNDLFSH